MTLKPFLKPLLLAACVLSLSSAQASLIERGNDLVYDYDLNVTWLQNANYADAAMSWDAADQWTSNLAYFDAVDDFYTGWRLPSLTELSHLLGTELQRVPGEYIYDSDISPFYGFVTGGKYWTSTEDQDSNEHAWSISSKLIEGTLLKSTEQYVWAVRDGDVKDLRPVPVPSMLLPFLGVLIALMGGRKTHA